MRPLGPVTTEVCFFQHPRDGIRYGQHQTAVLEYGVFTADTLELIDDFVYLDTGSQGKGYQTPDGFGLCSG